jgi:hypothetical protein
LPFPNGLISDRIGTMIIRNAVLLALLISGVLAGFSGCNKSPTESPVDINEPTIIFTCNPTTAAESEVISASVYIKGNKKELRVFGLDVGFDSRMFQFQEVRRGTLTGSWTAVDGNEVGAGSLRVGGFAGAGAAIPVPSEGTLAEIRFKVTGEEYGNGQQSQICARQYTDDLAGFQPAPACATFTLKK